ncbi:MAG: hypothetical protein CVV24_03790 [Ignavibacteriae bacterium HGW-Ignavibacteriae-3]|nr:MAG: hypothetical protein CVV24_03790 [Ignavibacteriae bacterium HGW-Ignavibacteriae-3]
MNFIEIISSVLIYGGGLLFLVVLISFLLSKMKAEKNRGSVHPVRSQKVPKIGSKDNGGEEQNYFRKNQKNAYPQIYSIESSRQRELKIIRKATAFTRDGQESYRQDSDSQMKTGGNGTRYTIINNESNKAGSNAANFYF